MSVEHLVRACCDRCPVEVTVGDDESRDGWGTVQAAPIGDGRRLALDLCPDCYVSLLAWRTDGSSAPAPAPPPPRKPEVSKAQRQAAVDEAESAIIAGVTAAIAVFEHSPTAILNKEIVPGALINANPLAASLVDKLIVGFGMTKRGR